MKAFLRALWPDPPAGNLTIWCQHATSKGRNGKAPTRSDHIPLAPLLAAPDEEFDLGVAELHARNVDGYDIYFALGLRDDTLGESQQGGKKNVVALPGWGVDFDIFNPEYPSVHKAQNLPTEDDISLLLDGAPDPTVVLHTAHGWHVYWRFNEPWVLSTDADRVAAQLAFKSFQAPFIERGKTLGQARGLPDGWKVDDTASIQRVFRLPGFINQKPTGTHGVTRTLHISNDSYGREVLAPARTTRIKESKTPSSPSMLSPAAIRKLVPVDNDDAPSDVYQALLRFSKHDQQLALMLAGKSFAERGGRDLAMQRVCGKIAFLREAVPHSPEELAEILRPSLEAWASEEEATKSIEEEMGKAVEKLTRAKQDKHDKDVLDRERNAGLAAALFRPRDDGEPGTVDGTGDATQEPMEDEVIRQHAIIRVRNSFWIRDFNRGRYVGPKIEGEVLTTARDAWATEDDKLSDYILTHFHKGEEKAKTLAAVMAEYCTVADNVLADLTLETSRYDTKTKIFHEAIAPMRVTEGEYDPQIAEWLDLLGGARKDKLLDWLAAVPRLDKPCCALYLDGAAGAGKGLLASGLARLWTIGAPTRLANVVGAFNADSARCPLHLLDEGLSKTHGNVSALLREMIGRESFSLSEKHVTNRDVRGANRIIIAANNDNVLAFNDDAMSANDLVAYVQRFLHIKVSGAASEWLNERNRGGEMTATWVGGDKIAKHCLWLAYNREYEPGKRFIVEGVELDEMHRKLVMQGEALGQITEWIARFMTEPKKLYESYKAKDQDSRCFIGEGRVLVNAQGLLDGWELYMGPKIEKPSTTKVGRTLSKISESTVKLGARGGQTQFHKVRIDLITGWADANQVGDADVIKENLEAAMPPVHVPKTKPKPKAKN